MDVNPVHHQAFCRPDIDPVIPDPGPQQIRLPDLSLLIAINFQILHADITNPMRGNRLITPNLNHRLIDPGLQL